MRARCGVHDRPLRVPDPKGPIRMTTLDEQPALDPAKLEQFVFRAVDEVGATLNAALVVMGDRLGLYRALAGAGPLTPGGARRAHRDRGALRARVAQRPGRRRLRRPTTRRRPLHACRPSRPSRWPTSDSPAFLPGFFQIALGSVHRLRRGSPRRARTGDGRRLARAQPRRATSAASASSAPATTPTSSRAGCPRSTASSRSCEAGGARRRRRLRPRRLDDPHGRRRSRTRRSSAPTTTPARSSTRPRARRARPGVGDRVTLRGRAGRGLHRGAATTS